MAVIAPAAPFALDAETVGLILLLVACYFAITILDATRPGIVSAAGSVPLVGGGLRSWVDGAVGGVRAWLYSTMQGGLVAFSATVDWLHGLAAQLAATLEGFGELTWAAVWRLNTQALPALELRLVNALAASAAATLTQARELVSQAEAELAAAVAGLEAEIGRGLVAADQARAAAVAGLEGELSLAVGQLESERAAAVAALEAQIGQALAVAEADARGWVVEGMAAVEADVAAVRSEVTSGVSALEQEVSQAQAALQRLIAQLSAAGALVGAGVLTEALADVIRLKNLRCIARCDPLSNLADFSAALDVGALIAFAVAWRQDQASAHPSFAPLIAQTVTDLENGVKQLAGGQ